MSKQTMGYWGTTGVLSFGLLGGGAAKLAGAAPMVESMTHLGFPTYLLTILGFWYVAAAVALLSPGMARVKEWAYAGIAFAMSGAVVAHVAVGDPLGQSMPALVLLGLAAASYVLRPASRRMDAGQHAGTGAAARVLQRVNDGV